MSVSGVSAGAHLKHSIESTSAGQYTSATGSADSAFSRHCTTVLDAEVKHVESGDFYAMHL